MNSSLAKAKKGQRRTEEISDVFDRVVRSPSLPPPQVHIDGKEKQNSIEEDKVK